MNKNNEGRRAFIAQTGKLAGEPTIAGQEGAVGLGADHQPRRYRISRLVEPGETRTLPTRLCQVEGR